MASIVVNIQPALHISQLVYEIGGNGGLYFGVSAICMWNNAGTWDGIPWAGTGRDGIRFWPKVMGRDGTGQSRICFQFFMFGTYLGHFLFKLWKAISLHPVIGFI